MKDGEKCKKELEVYLKQFMEDSEIMHVDERKVSWKSQTSRRVDTEKIKEAGLFDEYSYESVSRVLRIGKPKKKKK